MHRLCCLCQDWIETATVVRLAMLDETVAAVSSYLVQRCLLFLYACLQLLHRLCQASFRVRRVEIDSVIVQITCLLGILSYPLDSLIRCLCHISFTTRLV